MSANEFHDSTDCSRAGRTPEINPSVPGTPLLPCPFCGSSAELSSDRHTKKDGHAWCPNDECGVDIYGWTEADVVARWNKRAGKQ